MRAALAVIIVAGPSWAEPWIDYELLFQLNADKVVVSTDATGTMRRNIDLGDGVKVSCSDQGCVGMDTGDGAVGCLWTLALTLRALGEVCELPSDKLARLEPVYDRLAAFVAENAVPSRHKDDLEIYFGDMVRQYRDQVSACEGVSAPDSDVMALLDALSSQPSASTDSHIHQEDNVLDLDAFLANPRLPVMNPCF